MKDIRVAELFAGVGGFRLGLENSSDRFRVVWADQYEPERKIQAAYEVYKKRFGNKEIVNEDISQVKKSEIPDFDLLVGGFPCQDYSVVQAVSHSMGMQGKKGVLWWDIIGTIDEKKPRFVFLENVDRLLTSPGVKSNNPGRDFGMILRTLSDRGYGVFWKVVNAADYGFPQRRRRTFIFAFHKSTNYFNDIKNEFNVKVPADMLNHSGPFNVNLPNEKIESVQDVSLNSDKLNKLSDFSKNFSIKGGFKKIGFMMDNHAYFSNYVAKTRNSITIRDIIDTDVNDESLYLSDKSINRMMKLRDKSSVFKKTKDGHRYPYAMGKVQYPDSIDKPARTMVTSEHSINRMSHVIVDPQNNRQRFLTPEEAEKINTFPSGWTDIDGITKSARYFLMGNALVVNLVTEIGTEINNILDKEPEKAKKISFNLSSNNKLLKKKL
ncbi:DNA (cytosine-5-)-methyltransferase [Companilactobacillus allii]|uniref:Cytosine-specific methyltransferase n=1 Tax=Companilactobacillus allii TaxID=1847728 RepID=A0A1P8Q0S0_9LACO|nr:DNA (cytosine-5-)-methyltransferase [Companilactobacillus allii]APX71421.1 DNA (cytosine-5-)-methyltransferase [Companilactobacillus allii]USQ68502.1 DNA (cytosine-5-)-methyltransferase [Companilactobacillus allii]